MWTYLVALAVGDWQCLERKVDAVPIRVCAVPESKDKAQFALDVATHSIQFYNQWYGIRYPFGKLDMLAIPDYEWGGMENTASIFYRDTALLLDEATAAVFSMLESDVGPEVFRKGVNAYLRAHANGNATSADFWQAEAQASGKSIDQVMPTFVLQPGVPMVTVTSSCNGDKAQVAFTQQRFLLSPDRLNAGSPEQWQIPICMKFGGTDACSLVTAKTHETSLGQCPAWLVANRHGKGY